MIREFKERDADAAARLQRDLPWSVTAELLLHWNAALPPRARRRTWVADDDGEIVGWAEAELEWATERADVGEAFVLVRTDRRRRGIGAALYERGVEHLRASSAVEFRSGAYEPDGHRFLQARGYRPSREERMSAVDPRTVDTSALDALAARLEERGFRIVALAELEGRERELHSLYAEAAADMPADHAETNIPFDEWVDETLRRPDLSYAGSVVVLAGERPVSLAFISVDSATAHAENEMTGTAREYRGQGLARAAKLATIRWCAAQGIERLATGNDSTNAAMLAINRDLGYRPWITWIEYVLQS